MNRFFSYNAQLIFESDSFHKLIDETVAAIQDKNGNIIVGTQITVPSDNTKAVHLDTTPSGNSGQSGFNVTLAPGSTPQQGTNQVQESWMVPHQGWTEKISSSQDTIKWDQLEYIKMDLNGVYNAAVRIFDQQINYGTLAKYIIEKWAAFSGQPKYNTFNNINKLQEFIVKNKEKIFECQFDNAHFIVHFGIKTNFDGWNGDLFGKISYGIHGNIEHIEFKTNVSKVPKYKKTITHTGFPFEEKKHK